ncbi:hyaluronidase 1 [Lingula anatina]|uniref:Hyaluronidase n=1 Tax=Lingula anatina TaxID=7574 RepID=A0A1S3JKR1_LINAN|nr:hyaluronidase 1 [Lingula anatina]|eukprot:XP_013410962.1 hyaluronidase 1 [Lingula anatina]
MEAQTTLFFFVLVSIFWFHQGCLRVGFITNWQSIPYVVRDHGSNSRVTFPDQSERILTATVNQTKESHATRIIRTDSPFNTSGHLHGDHTLDYWTESEKTPKIGNKTFFVIWNVPSLKCVQYGIDLNLSHYNITSNSNMEWNGNIINIFYEDELGYYPKILENRSRVHGGLPQLVDIEKHLKKCIADIKVSIPSPDFSGLAVIDWESWVPTWERLWDTRLIYKNASLDLVRSRHPDWNETTVESEAKREWQSAAKRLMLSTLQVALAVRPKARWGFYLYPDCYNYNGPQIHDCTDIVKERNNELEWLFKESTVLLPSAYLDSKYDIKWKTAFVRHKIQEALRIRQYVGLSPRAMPVFLYSRFRHPDTLTWYSLIELNATIAQSKSLGTDGIVLWDDHLVTDTREHCSLLQRYVTTTLGPLVQKILNNS